jgi:hypothetical protein
MRKVDLASLLWLLSNYAEHAETVERVKDLLKKAHDYSLKEITDEDKKKMYWDTVATLNGGDEEAAFYIRLKALISMDTEFIDHIEYLHSVI